MMPADVRDRGLDLRKHILRATERSVRARVVAHARIAIGAAVSDEVERPRIESGIRQLAHPGLSVHRIRERESGGKGRTMDEENDAARGTALRRDVAKRGAWAVRCRKQDDIAMRLECQGGCESDADDHRARMPSTRHALLRW